MHMMVMFPINYGKNINCAIVGGWEQGYLVNVDKQTSLVLKQPHWITFVHTKTIWVITIPYFKPWC
jgi:hypothetical protein